MTSRVIRALRLGAHGAPLRIEQVPLREPGPGEVVVELAAAGVNPVDGYGARGLVAADGPLPRTLGAEASGWLDGTRVLVNGGGLGSTTDGVWAQAVTVSRQYVTPLDPSVDLTTGACLGVVGVTAWNTVVEVGKVTAADRVLVLGAGGGVGLAVISLALSAGATVVGQVGSDSKARAVRAFGATAVVADADTLARVLGDFVPTVVFDPLGGRFTPAALALLAQRGRHVIYGTSAGGRADIALQPLYRGGQQVLGYGGINLSAAERRAGADAAAKALTDGRLRIHVGRVLALSEAARVLDVLADRTLAGKLVIDCTG